MSDEHPTEAPSSEASAAASPANQRRFMREPGVRRYALLLATIVAAFAIQGIAHPAAWEQLLVTCLLGATLLVALWTVNARPQVRRAAMLVVGAMILISVIEAAKGVVDGRATRVVNGLLVALAPPAIIVGVVRTLRAMGTVTGEAVFGVL